MREKEVVSDHQLREYWQKLRDSIGQHQLVPKQILGQMRNMFLHQEFSKCILEIKILYRLMMTLRIGYLKDKKPSAMPKLNTSFELPRLDFGMDPTTAINQMVRQIHRQINQQMDELEGYLQSQFYDPAKEVPAWVVVPQNFPLYGSQDFDNWTVTMYLERSFTREMFETFVYGIAHEMAHILLWALRHPLAQSEIATDLVVVVMGFGEVFRRSRAIGFHQYGYLDNRQLDLALRFR